ncbi:MAG: TonB-dependent receptor [Bacteroidia bacterium]|nr:TonB-dependent receptor [Bacteroidia bacterium]
MQSLRGAGIFLLILLGLATRLLAQDTGTLTGKVFESGTKVPLGGAKVVLVGTYQGALTDEEGNFTIKGIKPGDYSIRISMIEYSDKLIHGVTINAGQNAPLSISMGTMLEGVVIEGEPNLVDLESGKSEVVIGAEDIGEMNVQKVQDVVKMQVGISENPDGIQIRGGRVYETGYKIGDLGIDANDPLAGTGFGVDVGSNSIEEIEVTTGGGDADMGNSSSGIIKTRIREGGSKYDFAGSYFRDNLGFNKNQGMSWNTDVLNVAFSGPVPFTKKKVLFFLSAKGELTDEYFNITADQLHSSLFSNRGPWANDSVWAPRQSNSWGNTVKVTWNVKPGMKVSVSNIHSLNINQSTRSLQIIGNNSLVQPGFQYPYSLDLDNANTYTHQSNLTLVEFKTIFAEKWSFSAGLGRLYTNLRADANGRPFRESTVDRIYDPASIVTDPVTVYNPNDSVSYVFPGPGLYNNGGIATLWHDHYAAEYTLKYKFSRSSNNKVHYFSFGQEHKEQAFQWIDVTRPWVGAPIIIGNDTTPSTRIGASSDVWKANPAMGAFYAQDEIRYKGIIASVGIRFEYWAPGKFIDTTIVKANAPVTEQTKEDYFKQTAPFAGRRWKARLLPKLRVSFPISSNNVLYFNYGHSTRLPHPRFLYAGLDPVYQDRSFLSNLGNPNLNPEVTVSYEVGIKSQLTKDLALTVTAFYNDKFDYIVSRRLLIRDQTGRFVEKVFYINQDYARIRGLELGIQRRIGKWLKVSANAAYQIATGKSNSAAESELQIKTQGYVSTTKEQYLAWDRPFDLKGNLIFKPDSTVRLFGLSLEGFRVFLSATFKSGLRYTPYVLVDTLPSGRPRYDQVADQPYSKIGSPWFWADLRISRDFHFGDKSYLSLSVEFQNIFNNKNSQIINGVTGTAYRDGDPLPLGYRDPTYPDPQDNGLPPTNPARYMQPRHFLIGASWKF